MFGISLKKSQGVQERIVDRKPIYVAGYPRSGTTWLTRLLGDALDCPTGGSMPSEDGREPATEGRDRPGPFVVRKGHFVLTDRGRSFVPAPHRMNPAHRMGERVVLVVRDPRDVIVSGAFYFKNGRQGLEAQAWNVIRGEGSMRSIGPIAAYMKSWLECPMPFETVRYECLLEDPERALLELDLPYPSTDRLRAAVERQSFAVKRSWILENGHLLPLGKTHNLHHLRKGIAGDWRNYFDRGLLALAGKHLTELLIDLGYEQRGDWWI